MIKIELWDEILTPNELPELDPPRSEKGRTWHSLQLWQRHLQAMQDSYRRDKQNGWPMVGAFAQRDGTVCYQQASEAGRWLAFCKAMGCDPDTVDVQTIKDEGLQPYWNNETHFWEWK
jgi:hypothetical protein